MSTLADPKILVRCCERVRRLRPDSARKWGKMTAHEMICHLNDSFRVAAGEKYASPATNFFQRHIIRRLALHTPANWPPGVPTRPEIEQGRGGTSPAQWEQDRAELCATIVAFGGRTEFGPHPMWGEMNRSDWMIWGYRHTDHHLRQFGV